MSQALHEQFLEWTFEQRWYGMHIAQMLCNPLMLLFYIIFVGWILGLMPLPLDVDTINRLIGLFCFVLFTVMLIVLRLSSRLPSRTLRIDRQTITLTDIYHWRTKERRMNASGAKFRAVYHMTPLPVFSHGTVI